MLKIEKIQLKTLQVEEHFAFMTDVRKIINNAGETVITAVTPGLPAFEAAVAREKAALERIRKNKLTGEIAEIDHIRDNLYYAIRLKTQAYSYSNIINEVEAAAELQIVLDHYGDFRRKPYNKEYGLITNFVEDFRKHPVALAMTDLEQWTNDLELVNENVQALLIKRDGENAVQWEELPTVRADVDATYERVTALVDASIVLTGEDGYVQFVDLLNQRIHYYKATVARRKTLAAKKGGEQPDEPVEPVDPTDEELL